MSFQYNMNELLVYNSNVNLKLHVTYGGGMCYLSGVRCRFAYGPADATATHYLLLAPINPDWFYLPGFNFLVPAHPGSPGQNPEEP